MQAPLQLQAAILAARTQTGDRRIGVQVENGFVDVVCATPFSGKRGAYTVTVLRASLTPAQAVAFLQGMH